MNSLEGDGRNARRVGSRRKLLIAGLRLIERGVYRPSVAEIAKQAGMHERSFNGIFGNIEGYVAELIEVHETSIRECIREDIANGTSLVRLVLTGKRTEA